MDDGLDSLVGKVFLKCVALLAQHGEYVEDIVMPVFPGGHGQERIVHLFYISQGYLAPATVVGIQMAQFHIEHCCLNLVETTVATTIVEDVLARRTVIGKCAECVGKELVVCGYGSPVAEGAEILSGIETVAGHWG